MAFPLSFCAGWGGVLACPVCGCANTHLDKVAVAARREDAQVLPIYVDAISGYVSKSGTVPGDDSLRRHRIALLGTCEGGCEFAVVFSQYKGTTEVDVLASEWRSVGGGK